MERKNCDPNGEQNIPVRMMLTMNLDLEPRLGRLLSRYVITDSTATPEFSRDKTRDTQLDEYVDRNVESPREGTRGAVKRGTMSSQEMRAALQFLDTLVATTDQPEEIHHIVILNRAMVILMDKIERREMLIRTIKRDNAKLADMLQESIKRIDHQREISMSSIPDDEFILTPVNSSSESYSSWQQASPRLSNSPYPSPTALRQSSVSPSVSVHHQAHRSDQPLHYHMSHSQQSSPRYHIMESPSSSPRMGPSASPRHVHVPKLQQIDMSKLSLYDPTSCTHCGMTPNSGCDVMFHHGVRSSMENESGDDFWRREVIESIKRQKYREEKEREKRHKRRQERLRQESPRSSSSAPSRSSSFHGYSVRHLFDSRSRSNSDSVSPRQQRNTFIRQQSMPALDLSQYSHHRDECG